MTITITIQDEPDGIALPDLTARLTRASFSTGTHGDESLQVSAPLSLASAFQRYDRAGLPHAIVTDGAARAFQGRVEDTTIRGNGFDLTAFGYSRSLSDAPYTALWSTTSTASWRQMTEADIALYVPSRFAFDTNNRLMIAPQKNGTYANAGADFVIGGLLYEIPSQSTRQIVGVQFDYVQRLPVGWEFGLVSRNTPGGASTTLFAIAGNTAVAPGSRCLTLTAANIVQFYLYYNAAAAVYAGETGFSYARVTNLRVVTSTANMVNTTHTAARGAGVNVTATVGTTARMYVGQRLFIGAVGATLGESVIVKQILNSTQFVADFTAAAAIGVPVAAHVIYADEIVRDLAATTAALNPTQLSTNTTQIASPARDLFDELYQDELPSAILDRLIGLGDTQTPPGIWEWGVDSLRQLYYRLDGADGLTWYVDVSAIDVQRSLEQLANSVYAVYRDPNGRALRSATATDAASVDRAGITRRATVQADTTDLLQATAQRDAALDDRANPAPRFGITFTAIYTAGGGRAPLWLPRAGDTIVIRNLPPTISPGLNQVQSFRIARTTCDLIARTLTVEPATPLPSLAALLARSLRGQTT